MATHIAMEALQMERAMQALEAGGKTVTNMLSLSVGAFCREPGLFYCWRLQRIHYLLVLCVLPAFI